MNPPNTILEQKHVLDSDRGTKVNFQDLSRSDLDHANSQEYVKKFEKGLSEKLIRKISADKNEPDWVLNIRLTAFQKFNERPLPTWGPDLSKLDFDNIRYFASASDTKNAKSWDDVDLDIKRTF